MYQHSDINEIDKQLNKNFENVCDWFVDNKLSKHYEEDKPNLFFLQLSVKSKMQEK